jgi:hypothetical protein
MNCCHPHAAGAGGAQVGPLGRPGDAASGSINWLLVGAVAGICCPLGRGGVGESWRPWAAAVALYRSFVAARSAAAWLAWSAAEVGTRGLIAAIIRSIMGAKKSSDFCFLLGVARPGWASLKAVAAISSMFMLRSRIFFIKEHMNTDSGIERMKMTDVN